MESAILDLTAVLVLVNETSLGRLEAFSYPSGCVPVVTLYRTWPAIPQRGPQCRGHDDCGSEDR
jgi:hypothetical protein